MDFMNLNQSAHGDREFGHMVSRLGIERKVVVGHWSEENVQKRIASWMRTAIGVIESSHVRVVRVGDNMRNVIFAFIEFFYNYFRMFFYFSQTVFSIQVLCSSCKPKLIFFCF